MSALALLRMSMQTLRNWLNASEAGKTPLIGANDARTIRSTPGTPPILPLRLSVLLRPGRATA